MAAVVSGAFPLMWRGLSGDHHRGWDRRHHGEHGCIESCESDWLGLGFCFHMVVVVAVGGVGLILIVVDGGLGIGVSMADGPAGRPRQRLRSLRSASLSIEGEVGSGEGKRLASVLMKQWMKLLLFVSLPFPLLLSVD